MKRIRISTTDTEALIRKIAAGLNIDPDEALRANARAIAKGHGKITIPSGWLPGVRALRIKLLRVSYPGEGNCGPECIRHAPF